MTDVLIIGGAALVGGGLVLLDWRLALVWCGALLMAAGLARWRGIR